MIRVKKASYLLFLLLAVACLDEPDCFNLRNDAVTFVFRKLYDGKLDTVTFVRTDVTGKSVNLFEEDTVVLSTVSVLVDYTAEQSLVKLKTFERSTSIDIGYRVQAQFISETCDPRFVLSELKVLGSDADSVNVPNSTPSAGGNINVYRCPRTNYIRIAFREVEADGDLRRDTLTITKSIADFEAVKLFADSGALSFVRLPLNPNSNTTTYTFTLPNNSSKTITFAYTRTTKVILPACGVQTVFDDLSILSSTFDRAELFPNDARTRLKRDSIYDPPIANFQVVH
ncbi:MAG: hypothetical protein O9302_15535 [Cyclobacteriaceae bacterium]|jgi:hypothetical protein|nr:hypothetical protein [Cytophagales bacterium]MCZ8329476.1 hypothetical protein [Cyclobacteriaceae bacterium]